MHDDGGPERRAGWSTADHDILIEVRTIVQRMDREMSSGWKEMWEKFGTHDSRIGKLETLSASLQPEKAHARYEAWGARFERFEGRWQGIVTGAGLVGSVAGYLLAHFLNRILQ